jgi:hypothetical protein
MGSIWFMQQLEWNISLAKSVFYSQQGSQRIDIFYLLLLQVFLRMGFSQAELDDYFTGPAFLAW